MSSEYSQDKSDSLHSAASVRYAQTLTRLYLRGERHVHGALRQREQNRDLRWHKIFEAQTEQSHNN